MDPNEKPIFGIVNPSFSGMAPLANAWGVVLTEYVLEEHGDIIVSEQVSNPSNVTNVPIS